MQMKSLLNLKQRLDVGRESRILQVFLCEQGIKRVTKSWTVKIKR